MKIISEKKGLNTYLWKTIIAIFFLVLIMFLVPTNFAEAQGSDNLLSETAEITMQSEGAAGEEFETMAAAEEVESERGTNRIISIVIIGAILAFIIFRFRSGG